MYKAVYDLDISTNEDKMAQHDREMVEAADRLMIPGSSGYKFIPFLHWLPSLNTSHLMLRQGLEAMSEVPWNLAMEDMNSNPQHSSLISRLLQRSPTKLTTTELNGIKFMAGQALLAAADTTMSAIATFFLAMSLYPDVQLKAQRELDVVIGPGKLPTFEDRSLLPYIEAVYREVMRWHPAIPMGGT
ncbi:cytochrome p450 [Stygiomarasmius scandens]|uniref:Cytochrome p450 n=1 Tax=Marasmiellus scandens TaxID=2682957 RepID=A0ABR1IUD5_9AGAR